MKTIIIENYIQGLGSYLDKIGIDWIAVTMTTIQFDYKDEKQLFEIAFGFGKFYNEN